MCVFVCVVCACMHVCVCVCVHECACVHACVHRLSEWVVGSVLWVGGLWVAAL